tara:strand:+ start:21276 stop:21542 length:267 start_codon:yes stop_codon:yes gene_type:complete
MSYQIEILKYETEWINLAIARCTASLRLIAIEKFSDILAPLVSGSDLKKIPFPFASFLLRFRASKDPLPLCFVGPFPFVGPLHGPVAA